MFDNYFTVSLNLNVFYTLKVHKVNGNCNNCPFKLEFVESQNLKLWISLRFQPPLEQHVGIHTSQSQQRSQVRFNPP